MRRGYLGRRIEFYTHRKYGGNVPIYLSSTGEFSAVIGDVILKGNQKNELIKLVDETLKNQTNLEWIPIIEIEFGYRWGNSRKNQDERRNSVDSEVKLQFVRFWIAQKIDSRWIEAHWDIEHFEYGKDKKVEIGDRLERSRQFRISGPYDKNTGRQTDLTEFKLPYTEKEDRSEDEMPKYYVGYTDELWRALNQIADRMQELQVKIVDVLRTPESRARLVADVSKLLPAPAPEPKKKRG